MQIIIFILSFIIFLYTLYKLVKDDHVFLRRNIKPEQFFDITFFVVIAGLAFTNILSQKHIFSLTYFVLGSAVCLYLIGKYKKLALSRLFDFFTLSFLTALPAGLMLSIFAEKRTSAIIFGLSAFVYLSLAIYFRKSLLAKVMSRKLREGIISLYFIMFFSVFTFIINLFSIKKNFILFNIDNIILLLFFVFGSIKLLKASNKRNVNSS